MTAITNIQQSSIKATDELEEFYDVDCDCRAHEDLFFDALSELPQKLETHPIAKPVSQVNKKPAPVSYTVLSPEEAKRYAKMDETGDAPSCIVCADPLFPKETLLQKLQKYNPFAPDMRVIGHNRNKNDAISTPEKLHCIHIECARQWRATTKAAKRSFSCPECRTKIRNSDTFAPLTWKETLHKLKTPGNISLVLTGVGTAIIIATAGILGSQIGIDSLETIAISGAIAGALGEQIIEQLSYNLDTEKKILDIVPPSLQSKITIVAGSAIGGMLIGGIGGAVGSATASVLGLPCINAGLLTIGSVSQFLEPDTGGISYASAASGISVALVLARGAASTAVTIGQQF